MVTPRGSLGVCPFACVCVGGGASGALCGLLAQLVPNTSPGLRHSPDSLCKLFLQSQRSNFLAMLVWQFWGSTRRGSYLVSIALSQDTDMTRERQIIFKYIYIYIYIWTSFEILCLARLDIGWGRRATETDNCQTLLMFYWPREATATAAANSHFA